MTKGKTKSRGIQKSLPGNCYQIKLLMLYMHRCVQHKFEFQLTTEDENADKLDDIILRYKKDGEVYSHRFVQAKHKQNDSAKISYKDLLNDGDGIFSLKKYFLSYRNMKTKFHSAEKEYIIYTNIGFGRSAQNVVEIIHREDPLMDTFILDEKKCSQYCKFKINKDDKLYKKLKSSTDSDTLAKDLAKLINKNKRISRTGLFKTYQKWLITNVIDLNNRSIKRDIATDTPFSLKFFEELDNRNAKINLAKSFYKIDENGLNLIDLEASDEEILDYLDNLIFAVNQPNEKMLSEIITKELGAKYNLLQAEIVTDIFFREIVDWVKNTNSEKHTNTSGKKFFEGIKTKIENLMNANIDLLFIQTVKSCSIDFIKKNKDLIDFLDDNNLKVLNFKCPDTFVGFLEVYYNIEKLPSPYRATDNKIYVDMDYAISVPSILQKIGNMFKQTGIYNLLIIRCRNWVNKDHGLIQNLLNVPNGTNLKKIILISIDRETHYSDMQTYSAIKFSDIAKKTQKTLENRKINFQGNNKLLCELVESTYMDAIQGKFLGSLILNETIKVGNKLNEVDDLYIPRKFNQMIEIDMRILTETMNITENIIITGEDISELEIKNTAIKNKTSGEWGEKDFDNTSEGIHWLKFKNNKLIWHRSNRSIKDLIPFRTEKTLEKEENDLLDEKFCIISDIAGMGKSTILTKLANRIKKLYESRWVVTIDLNLGSCQTALRQNDIQVFNKETTKRFLADSLLDLGRNCILEKDLFVASLEDGTKTGISLLIDGFDEICPEYEKLVINFLEALKELNIASIFVTTRPHLRETLEARIGVFSYALDPFPPIHQREYLLKVFKSKLGSEVNEQKKERVEKYVDCLIHKINKREQQFIGVPLHIKMVAEIFCGKTENNYDWESCEEFIIGNKEDPILPKSLGLIKLYALFYEHKIAVYQKNKSRDELNSINLTDALKSLINRLFKYQQTLALKLFFNEQEINNLGGQLVDIDKYEQNQLPKIGFVINTGNEKKHPEFTHRTYAEYFVAQFFIHLLKKPNHKVRRILFTKVLLNLEFELVRAFLNSHLLTSDLENTEGSYLALLWKEDPRLVCNEHGQSILQVVAEEGDTNLIDFILDDLKEHEEIKKVIIQHEDREGQTALHSAVKSGCLETVKKLYDPNLPNRDKFKRSFLYIAALHRHWDVVKWLLKKVPSLKSNDINVKRVFHLAAIAGRLDVVKHFLKENIFDRLYIRTSGILSYIITHDQLNVLKWILEQKYYSIDNEDDYETLLYAAFEHRKQEIVTYLKNCVKEFGLTYNHIEAEFSPNKKRKF